MGVLYMDLKSELRCTLKQSALNSYGKTINQLTLDQLETLLRRVYREYLNLVEPVAEFEYDDIFNKVFKKELTRLQRGF